MNQSDDTVVVELGKEVLKLNIMGWFGLGLGNLVLFGTDFYPLLALIGFLPAVYFFCRGIRFNRMYRAARAVQGEKEQLD